MGVTTEGGRRWRNRNGGFALPAFVLTRGGYNSDDITRVGVGGGGVEPGGSDDGMTITICSFSSSDSSSSGSADTDDSELQAILAKGVKK